MFKPDYYDLLGIDCSATKEEIKKSYRRLAHQFHPDKNPGNSSAEEHFKRITEAYEVLQDPQKRAAYDRQGASLGRRGYEGFREHGGFSSGRDIFDDFLGEVFGEFFGTGKSRSKKKRGVDLHYNLDVSLEEAAFGTEREIRYPRLAACPMCLGSCCFPGTRPATCPACKGFGFLRAQRGFFLTEITCYRCQGLGQIISRPCSRCQGMGFLKMSQVLRMDIPLGVDTGTRLRVKGHGEMGKFGGPPGDFYVVIAVKKHPIFSRSGNDLRCEVPLSLSQAVQGGEIEVPILRGTARMKIPAGTPPGKTLILKGQGMPASQGAGRGDLRITMRVEIPRKPTKRQQEWLKELNRLNAGD